MVTFTIHHGVKLRSTGAQLVPFQRYSTDKEDEVAELRELGKKFKLCTEEVPLPPKPAKKKDEPKAEEAVVDPTDDISLVKGLGASGAKKLAEVGITTLSGLKAAMKKDKQKVVDAVGPLTAAKVEKFFEGEVKAEEKPAE